MKDKFLFLFFAESCFSFCFHGTKGQFDETAYGENERPKEFFQRPFHSCLKAVSLYVHELAEKSKPLFFIARRKKISQRCENTK